MRVDKMILEQAKMLLSEAGVAEESLKKIPKIVLLWKDVGLAIHKSMHIADKGLWVISHFNSGRSVVKYLKTKEQAINCLCKLYEILPDWTFTEEKWSIQADETKRELKEVVDRLQQQILEGKAWV